MARKYAPQAYNVQHYKKIAADLAKAEPTDEPDEFWKLIGRITTTFELCEALLASLLKQVTEDPDLLGIVFSVINARATRNQIILELLQKHRPTRPNKHYVAVATLFDTYALLGPRRDEVAHSVLIRWEGNRGIVGLKLQPAWHVERKSVAGLPKYHYDLKKLQALADEIDQLLARMNTAVRSLGERNTRRLTKRRAPASPPEPAK